jgi:hypothetical protein
MMAEGEKAWHMSLGHSDAARQLGFGNTGLQERVVEVDFGRLQRRAGDRTVLCAVMTLKCV